MQSRGAILVTAGIFLSRIFGLVRQRVIAHYLGTSEAADVLAAAFRLGNITQNLVGEGTLSASFIPVYAKLRAGQEDSPEVREQRAKAFAEAALGLLLVTALAASAVGILLAPLLTGLVTLGFDGGKQADTIPLVRIVFPMTGLMVLSAWGLGVLNARRQFFLPYAAPVVWNLAQIAAAIVGGAVFYQRGAELAQSIAVGALVGAGLQFAILLTAVWRALGGVRPRLSLAVRGVREAVRRLPGAVFGRGIIQLSGLIDTLLVSFLGAGAYASFTYAQTLYLLPMSLLGTGEAAAALPELSEATAERAEQVRRDAMRKQLQSSIRRVATLAIPASFFFWTLGGELVTLILQTGAFDRASTQAVRPVLATYGIALTANAISRVLSTTCFALGDTSRPAKYALIRVCFSTVGSLLFMQKFGVTGVVLGAVLAAWVELGLLGRRVSVELSGLELGSLPWIRILALGALSCGFGLGIKQLLAATGGAALDPNTMLGSFLVLAAFGVAFVVISTSLRLFDVRSLLRRRR